MVHALVPVEVLESETVPQGVIDLLAPANVTVLGYHVVPEQTSPDQARLSFEDRARDKLDDIEEAFEIAGSDVTTRLVFTHDSEQTFDRVAAETDADVVVHLNPSMDATDLLVALHGAVAAERIGEIVAVLVAGRDIDVRLREIAGPNEDTLNLLERARRAMEDGGVGPDRIDAERIETDRPVRTIAELAAGTDATVLGERAADWQELVFGDFEERVADASLGAVLVVRPRTKASDD